MAGAAVCAAVVGLFGVLASNQATAATPPGGGLSAADVAHVQAFGKYLTTSKSGKHVKAVKVHGDKVFAELFPDVVIGGPNGDQTAALKAQDLVVTQSTGADVPTGMTESQAYGVPTGPNVVVTTVMDGNGWVIAVTGATASTPDTAPEKKGLVTTFGSDVADIVVTG